MNYVVKKRLQWSDLTSTNATAFSNPSTNETPLTSSALTNDMWSADLKIIYNDWPYGIDEKIIHLVVWSKFDLEDDPAIDDLTPRMRREINQFVDGTFCKRVPAQNVRKLFLK